MSNSDTLKKQLLHDGLYIKGAFAPTSEDALPTLTHQSEERSLVLVGNLGSSLWPMFSISPEYLDRKPNPLDRWSKRIAGKISTFFMGLAFYPFEGPPYHPFVSWAKRSTDTYTSPLGLGIHKDAGLWHAYRFALLLPFKVETHTNGTHHHCNNCRYKPCLSTCPVSAFTGVEYKSNDCINYLKSTPKAKCNETGCLARHACPIGKEYTYTATHAQFHMRAFISSK